MSHDPRAFEQLIRDHVAAEDDKDADRVRATYCSDPRFVDVPMGVTLHGWDAILAAYRERWVGFPAMVREITRIQSGPEGCFIELVLRGRHEGPYRGLPPTGDLHQLRVCAHFAPSPDGLIAVETAYYDSLTVAVTLGILPDVRTGPGRLWLAMHRPSLLWRRLRGKLLA